MDRSNPAVSKHTSIPPATLERIVSDPLGLAPWARALLVQHIDEMDTRLANDPDSVPIGQKMEFMNFLAKLGDAMPKPQQQVGGPGAGFGVTIVLTTPAKADSGKSAPLVIDNGQ